MSKRERVRSIKALTSCAVCVCKSVGRVQGYVIRLKNWNDLIFSFFLPSREVH